jgi:hypothetical protein
MLRQDFNQEMKIVKKDLGKTNSILTIFRARKGLPFAENRENSTLFG